MDESLDYEEPQIEVEEPKYWADLTDLEELAAEIKDRVRDYFQRLDEAGFIELWESAHSHFYSLGPTGHEGSRIIQFGEDGEKLGVKANHLRSIGRYMINATTADKLTIKPKAKNSSAKARAQVPTAGRVMAHYHYVKDYHKTLVKVATRAVIYAKGYLWQYWDPAQADGGDLVYKALSPLQVATDLDRDEDDHDWWVVIVPRNKYDLAALKPDKADDIINMSVTDLDPALARKIQFGFRSANARESDLVWEYHFFHRKTPALPEGRYTIVVGSLVRFDGPLPYKTVPIDCMVPEEFECMGDVGYASLWDLIGLQDWYDALTSTGMTNMDALGHHDILLPEGVELGLEEIRGGLNVIRYPAGEFNKPSILEKFSLREEFFKLRDAIRSDMEMLPGVNQVARGQPEASLKSGAALALVEAQAIKFQTGTIRAYNSLVSRASTRSIEILSLFCPPERIQEIAGSGDPDGLAAFSDGKLDMIGQVECEMVSPIFNTLGGRQQAADNMLAQGMIKDPGQYIAMIETGRPETAIEGPMKMGTYYAHVREVLQTAPPVEQTIDELTGQPRKFVPALPVTILDNPELGLKAAQDVSMSIELRQDPKVMDAVTAFAMETLRVWRLAPPDMLVALGYPPPPSKGGMPVEEDKDKPAGKGGSKAAPPGKAPPEGGGIPGLPAQPKPAQSPLEDKPNESRS